MHEQDQSSLVNLANGRHISAQAQTQRIIFMSRGLSILIVGLSAALLFCSIFYLSNFISAWYTYAIIVAWAFGVQKIRMTIEEHRAQGFYYVRTGYKDSWRGLARLWGFIVLGVVLCGGILLLLLKWWSSSLVFSWWEALWTSFLFCMALGFSLSFARLAVRCQLWELGVVALWFFAMFIWMCIDNVYVNNMNQVAEHIFIAYYGACMLGSFTLMAVLGLSLHLRWLKWRRGMGEQTL